MNVVFKCRREKMNHSPLFAPSGFILVTTLWVLAMLTMAASFFALWTQRTVEVALSSQADIQGEIDGASTQAVAIYLLSTQKFNIGGLTVPEIKPLDSREEKPLDPFAEENDSVLPVGGEIALDDRPYFGQGKALFALQDEVGLININTVSDARMARFLHLLGVEEKLLPHLIDKFKDYIDIDEFHRINGAEAYHYQQQNLPPPPNRYLLHPMEVKQVLGWRDQTVLWKNDQLNQLTHLFVAARPNINTAPSLVLQAAYNINKEAAERIIKTREKMPFYQTSTVTEVTGMVLDLDEYESNFFPSNYLRLTLWYQGARRMRQIHIQLMPMAEDRKPWQIEYTMEFQLLPKYTTTPPRHVQTTLFDTALPTATP